jgi:NAD(P)-dependent dehydrogenase (short-subunit alcohol dehydrogenase family)
MTGDVDVTSLFGLRGRVAVVTGGAGPLGKVLCDTLASLGARVLVVDRDAAACDAVASTLASSHSVQAHGLGVDLLSENAVEQVSAAVGELGSCDILVNNAAFTGTSGVAGFAVPFELQTDAAFELAQQLNVGVPFALVRTLAPMLGASGRGSVVNVSSIYGLVGPNMTLYEGTTMGNPAAYAASKGALAQLTRYLATVLAPAVRVNAFAPGGISRGQDPSFVARYEQLTPLRRMATTDDFRGVLAWLASDASSYVTGQVVAVDGGWTAW